MVTPSRFFLDASGVASLLGEDDALTAMTAVHVYENRRWLGWYNTPGSLQISKRLDSFARSASFHNVFRGSSSSESSRTRSVHVDPAALLGLDSCKVPKYRAAHSGTIIAQTSYVGALFMKECAALGSEGKVVPGRWTQPVGITIADLGSAPDLEPVGPAHSTSTLTPLFASIPILTSIGTCALCATHNDWYTSLRILLGTIASGVSCFVLGSADFVFTHPEPVNGSPPGDGILSLDQDIVLLRGTEGSINSIVHGKFDFRLSCESHHNLVRLCSVLYFIQGITQLLLIPQVSLFGQAMFLTSLGVSALYNAWLASLNKEQHLGRILFERVLGDPTLTKYTFGSRTTAVMFALLVLRLQNPTELLDELFPEDTVVCRLWKVTILGWLRHPSDQSLQLGGIFGDLSGLTQQERTSLELLYEDAQAAYNGYRNFLQADSQ